MSALRFARLAGLALAALPLSALACEGRLHIELQQTGVYFLDYDAIVAQQPGLRDCTADQLTLTQRGKEAPIRVSGEADGRFGPGARIEWIGQQLHGPESWFDPFSVENVYMLGAAPGKHARLVDAESGDNERAPLARKLHLEQENLMIRLDQQQQQPGEESDVWQWAKLTHVDPEPFSTAFDLPDLAAHGDVALTLNFRGLSDLVAPATYKSKRPDDHSVIVSINGKPVATLGWNGRGEIRREIKLPAAQLKARANTLSLRVPKRNLPWGAKSDAVDVVMFNWIEARYAVSGDLDAGALPFTLAADGAPELSYRGKGAPVLYGSDGKRRVGRSLGGNRYAFAAAGAGVELFPALEGNLARPDHLRPAADARWMHPAQPYDYLIVAHPKLIDAIKPLAAFHEQRGLKVAILDINDVYDEFNDGITHPRAIRNLVDRAWHEWPAPQPRFLLLVGDASFDIRHDTYNDLNYAKWTNLELLYPNHFGSVAGSTYANTPKKLADRNLIPTWQYPSPEGQSASDNWFGSVGIDWHPVVAVGRFPVIEPAEVTAIVDKTIDYLSKPQLGAWRRDVMFITDEITAFQDASDDIAGALGKEGFLADKVYANPKVSENATHQNAIRQGIDDGRLIVHFIGHGGRFIWRTGPPDLRKNQDLFTLNDVDSLKNASLPMVLSMTCYSAPFDNPTEDSIGEKFLREPGKGAIAVFAASWRNAPSATFSKAIIDELLKPGATIGEAIVNAKKTTPDRTLVEMYNLLGDPAVVLERPRDLAKLSFDDERWNAGVDIDLGTSRFKGKLAVDWIDAKGNKLASNTYTLDQSRFRLAVPSLASGTPNAVRIYAASPGTGHDFVGGVDLVPSRPGKPWRVVVGEWWRRVRQPASAPMVWHADTIAQSGFDDPDAARHVEKKRTGAPAQAASGAR